jgi:Cu(I)/Ag(I) efflux system membrane fusion protein
MKTRSTLFTMMLVAAFTFSNCGGNKKGDSPEHADHDEQTSESVVSDEATKPQFNVDATFQQQLANVFNAYLSVKEAFVSSDAAKVTGEADATLKSLSNVDMSLLTGAAHNDWMNYMDGMETSLETMKSSSDLEMQREAFSDLSDNLYKSIKAYGLGGTTAYYEFCPMAFDNEGGYWLSDAKEIRNPYFGDKMMSCGSVKEVLQ